jgi:hypothetical protein
LPDARRRPSGRAESDFRPSAVTRDGVLTVHLRSGSEERHVDFDGVYRLSGPVGLGFGVNVILTRDGRLYVGPEVHAGVAGASGSIQAGWSKQCPDPSSDQLDSFADGFGTTGGGPAPALGAVGPAGGEAWGNEGGTNASDFSTSIGVGASLGHSLSINQGYNWRTGIETPRW